MNKALALAGILVAAFPSLTICQERLEPPGSMLADDDGWELVYAHCSACHSLRLVVAQRGDRETWLRLIRWMQQEQNLWEFEPAVEDRILDYLAKNYPPRQRARRAPLPEHLVP